MNLSIINETGGQFSKFYAEKKEPTLNVSYFYSGGWTSGGSGGSHTELNYSDPSIEYTYRDIWHGANEHIENFDCKRGNCGFAVTQNTTIHPRYQTDFVSNTVCYSNGTFDSTLTKDNKTIQKAGTGCPVVNWNLSSVDSELYGKDIYYLIVTVNNETVTNVTYGR